MVSQALSLQEVMVTKVVVSSLEVTVETEAAALETAEEEADALVLEETAEEDTAEVAVVEETTEAEEDEVEATEVAVADETTEEVAMVMLAT